MTQVIDLRPKIVDVVVLKNDRWDLHADFPFDVTGYVIVAKLKKTNGTVVNLQITPDSFVAGTFWVGQVATDSGIYQLTLTPTGGNPRTWIKGRLKVEEDPIP